MTEGIDTIPPRTAPNPTPTSLLPQLARTVEPALTPRPVQPHTLHAPDAVFITEDTEPDHPVFIFFSLSLLVVLSVVITIYFYANAHPTGAVTLFINKTLDSLYLKSPFVP